MWRVGAGKMPDPEVLESYIIKEVAFEKDLKGKKVLITAVLPWKKLTL